jgi:hypothetical protein
MRATNHLVDLNVDKIILKRMWIGFNRLKIRSSGGILGTQQYSSKPSAS